jgi:anti-sigma factor RsiW
VKADMSACHYSRKHLDAYIANELPPTRRARIARHLDGCTTCYAAYVRQRDNGRELARSIPLVGRGQEPDFEHLRRGIMQELRRGSPPPRYANLRYGLAAVALTLIFIMPFMMSGSPMHAAPPVQQPVPQPVAVTRTPDSAPPVNGATAVASLTLVSAGPTATSVPTLPEPETTRGIDGSDS